MLFRHSLLRQHPYITIFIIILLLCAGLFVYAQFDPASSIFFPDCIFNKFTGLKCPGCGTQRALHAFLNGNFIDAIRFNAFLLVAIPIIIYYTFIEVFRSKFPRLHLASISPIAIIAILIITIAWWIGRNIAGI